MTAQASSPPAWLRAAGLPQSWHGRATWRVLDTDFGNGERLRQLWQAWLADPDACHVLHVVALASATPSPPTRVRDTESDPTANALARELETHWFGLMPGFNRLVLQSGRLHLTLCIGPRLEMLREQQFSADSIVVGPSTDASATLDGSARPWDSWAIKALARLSRRGSTLAVLPHAGLGVDRLAAAGWITHAPDPAAGHLGGIWSGQYQPAWQIKTTRKHWAQTPTRPSHCVVVGAGLAGAAAAGALALRGWQVTVLDAAPEPAAGASSLPVGLFAPQLSRDDGSRSRLSRAGIRATLHAAHRLLHHGQDWARSGIAQIDATMDALPSDWPAYGHDWTCAASDVEMAQGTGLAMLARPDRALWHAAAGWIKPRQLVRAWLSHSAIRFQGGSAVSAIRIDAGHWQLHGPGGRLLAEAPQLVLAGAGGSQELLHQALAAARQAERLTPLPLAPVDGQVSWALHGAGDAAAFPPFPVNGAGSVAGQVPWSGGPAWFSGATYEPTRDPAPTADTETQAHRHNRARLAQLLPDAAARVVPAFAEGAVHAWRGTRWTTADRLPLVGAWPLLASSPLPGLWLSTGMGSRGLTYAALCGELIAAQMGAEPLPLDTGLHRCIDVRRVVAPSRR